MPSACWGGRETMINKTTLARGAGHAHPLPRRKPRRRRKREPATGISDPCGSLSRTANGERGLSHASAMVDVSDDVRRRAEGRLRAGLSLGHHAGDGFADVGEHTPYGRE